MIGGVSLLWPSSVDDQSSATYHNLLLDALTVTDLLAPFPLLDSRNTSPQRSDNGTAQRVTGLTCWRWVCHCRWDWRSLCIDHVMHYLDAESICE